MFHNGSCHCGPIALRAMAPAEITIYQCNCPGAGEGSSQADKIRRLPAGESGQVRRAK